MVKENGPSCRMASGLFGHARSSAIHRGCCPLGQTVHHNTASYDPTENCGYHNPAADHPTTLEIGAAAKAFFLVRPVDVIEGHGSDPGSYEFEFDFAIALDTKNGLIFSFVWNLAD